MNSSVYEFEFGVYIYIYIYIYIKMNSSVNEFKFILFFHRSQILSTVQEGTCSISFFILLIYIYIYNLK